MQIALPIIALLMIVGAWRFWRRNPLYSVKSTLKIAGIFLLIVAAIVGASMAILHGPISHSPMAQAILGGLVIIAIATGATGIIIRITDSHVPQAPPAVHLVTIHRHKVQRWLRRTVVYELTNAVAALLLPYAWKWLPLSLGGFLLLLCGPMMLGFYMRARRLDFGMSVVIGGPWAHWQYTASQWESWAKNQLAWEQSKIQPMVLRRDWRKLLKAVSYMTAIFVFGALLSGGSVREKVVTTAGMVAFVVLIIGCTNRFNRQNCERHYRRLLAAPPEAYFGDEGLFCNGEYSPWILSGSYLLEATATSDPPAHLILTFQSFKGTAPVVEAKRILIPEGRWPDVEMLQRKLEVCCPKAFIHMVRPAA